MRLYEFEDANPLAVKIVTVADQIKSDIDEKDITYNWDVDTLLKYFRKYGITLDKNDLFNMIQKPPLKNLIRNIEGDKVVFKNQQDIDAPDMPQDQGEKIVNTMAKKALKK